ncbi:PE-PGRS family protein PE_PGRS43 [Mycobacterium tuberculosis]|nr:PE-PGRS family protein PE_PGRS43 [Mycobacterium tuberculosis]
MPADTSSAPAATTSVVGIAATALAALTCEPIRARSKAAVAIISGVAITYDISHLPNSPTVAAPLPLRLVTLGLLSQRPQLPPRQALF